MCTNIQLNGRVRKKVLVVDDNQSVRELTKSIIEREFSFEMHEATNGNEAFDLLQNSEYSLLITDIHMPEMNGVELINKLRTYGSFIPIIVVSGMLNFQTREYLSSIESIHIIEKPFNIKSLIEIINNIITKKTLFNFNQKEG
jgi:YesN/AraC family two-component response regulator